ncbi:MAG: ROK family protein [Elusimicrobia bacterium]|nr:ROK family protein [Elusimicrobiota bacterium]
MSAANGAILVVDVGGSHVKAALSGRQGRVKLPSGPRLTAAEMVRGVRRATGDWGYARVTIGYPGPVAGGRPLHEPANLGRGWVGFDFRAAFARPVKVINDAAMQALGSYKTGRMLFLGLGTGLGTAMVVDGILEPMELSHLPYKKGRTYEDYLGRRGLDRRGKKKWRRSVFEVAARLKAALEADEVVLGGGNAKKLGGLPTGYRLGGNELAFRGGVLLWERD